MIDGSVLGFSWLFASGDIDTIFSRVYSFVGLLGWSLDIVKRIYRKAFGATTSGFFRGTMFTFSGGAIFSSAWSERLCGLGSSTTYNTPLAKAYHCTSGRSYSSPSESLSSELLFSDSFEASTSSWVDLEWCLRSSATAILFCKSSRMTSSTDIWADALIELRAVSRLLFIFGWLVAPNLTVDVVASAYVAESFSACLRIYRTLREWSAGLFFAVLGCECLRFSVLLNLLLALNAGSARVTVKFSSVSCLPLYSILKGFVLAYIELSFWRTKLPKVDRMQLEPVFIIELLISGL